MATRTSAGAHLQAGCDAPGQGLDGLPGAAPGLGLAVQGDAAAGRLDQDVEGVLDQGRVTPARSGDGANGLVGEGQEL